MACWLAAHGEQLGSDPAEITVMGDSAGANLAAAVCLLARREAHAHIRRQIHIYPALDATLSTPSMTASAVARRDECNVFYSHYVGAADRTDELISPLLADDLSDLPPCLIITADRDALRDDGRLYAARLRDANVPVRFTNYLGMPHGFLSMPRLCRAAPQALAEIADELAISSRSMHDSAVVG
jgi:acetyl esterase/lipase